MSPASMSSAMYADCALRGDFNALPGLQVVDLLNMNIEGIEFELMDALLASGKQRKIRNLQIQFHVHAGVQVDDKIGKRCKFHAILQETHELVYNFPWVWEQWSLRE